MLSVSNLEVSEQLLTGESVPGMHRTARLGILTHMFFSCQNHRDIWQRTD